MNILEIRLRCCSYSCVSQMDETPPTKSRGRTALGYQLHTFHWVRVRGYFVHVNVTDDDSGTTIFAASLKPPIRCSARVGNRSGTNLPLEDHYVLRDELRDGTWLEVKTGLDIDVCKIDHLERFLQQKCQWGSNAQQYHKLHIQEELTESAALAQEAQEKVKRTRKSKPNEEMVQAKTGEPVTETEVTRIFNDIEGHLRWNEAALQQLRTLRSYLNISNPI